MKANSKIRYGIILGFLVTILGNFLGYINVIKPASSVMVTYFFVLFPILMGFFPIMAGILNQKFTFIYLSELRTGIFVTLTFLVLSLYRSITNHCFILGTLGELARILVPFVYAFIALNFLTQKDIHFILVVSLIIGWLAFTMTTNFSSLNLKSLATISFVNSQSPLENSEVSFLSYALAIYFIYFSKKYPISCFFSVILVLLTFKRVFMLSLIVLLGIKFLKLENKKLNNAVLYISSIIFILLIRFYNFMVQPQNYSWDLEKMHLDIASFSMYRVYRVWYLIQNNFSSYGLGSTTDSLKMGYFTGTTLEMDFIKFIMELGFVSIIIFIFSYYRLTRNNLYNFCVMSFTFLQLLMANGMLNYYEWSIILLTMGIAVCSNDKFADQKIRWPFL